MLAATDTVPGSGEPGRRTFLNWLLGLWATGVAASILYPILRYLVPPDIPEAPTQSIDAGKASLAPNSGRVVAFGSAPAIVAVGERALHELQVRRLGLLGATIVILGFLVTLWFKIRRFGGLPRA